MFKRYSQPVPLIFGNTMSDTKPALLVVGDRVIETSVHSLKTWKEFFHAVSTGEKTHEFRKNDRDFKVGDLLELIEYDHEECRPTGNKSYHIVTYILTHDKFTMIPVGWVDLSIKNLPSPMFIQ